MGRENRNAFIYATIVAMGGFVFGLDAALISGTVSFITSEFSLTDLQLGTVVSAPGLGVLFALPLAGYASNLLGRKKTLLIISALYIVSAVSSALAPSFYALVAARFLGGLAFSSITLASMYIGEIAPADSRGKLVSMIQVNIVIGLAAAYFINYLIQDWSSSGAEWVHNMGLDKYTWRWMLGSEILPAFVWFLMLFIIPRSPAWLLFKNRNEEAENTMRKILPQRLIADKIREMQESLDKSRDQRSVMEQLKEIFSKPMRIILIIGLTVAIVQQVTGINAILFYAPTVIEQLGLGTDAAFLQTVWIGLISVIFTVLSLLLIDKVGRRPLFLLGLLWICISLAMCSYGFKNARYIITKESITEMKDVPNADQLEMILGVEYKNDIEFKTALKENLGVEIARDYSGILLQKSAKMNAVLILVGILSFIAAFQFSVGPIMWVLFSELFPISLRGIAIPFFALITSTTSYFVQQFFPYQLATMGSSSVFLFYAVMVFIGLIILYRYLPETKNMSIEEIQISLRYD